MDIFCEVLLRFSLKPINVNKWHDYNTFFKHTLMVAETFVAHTDKRPVCLRAWCVTILQREPHSVPGAARPLHESYD
jgi:hypothetical protein